MRILVLASTFPRWTGDTVPPFVHHLSAGLGARGHEVHVLAPHAPGARRFEEMDRLQVHRFRYAPDAIESLAYGGGILENLRRDPKRWLLVIPFIAAQLVAMVQLARRHKIEVVHAHWILPQGLVAALGRSLLRCPVVVSAHGSDVFSMKTAMRRRFLKFAARRADICTAVSAALQLELELLSGVKAVIIPMGVDQSAFQARPKRSADRLNGATPRILFVGRLVEQKGVRHLLQAMALICPRFPRASLEIVGDGPDRPALEELARALGIESNVSFVGAIRNSQMPTRYHAATVLVLPSIRSRQGDTEGLPVVLLEAAASGLPVVASDIGGIGDVVRHEDTGLLVEPGDPEGIAQAVARLLDDEALRSSLAARARELVTERFTWDSVVLRFDSIFRSLHAAS